MRQIFISCVYIIMMLGAKAFYLNIIIIISHEYFEQDMMNENRSMWNRVLMEYKKIKSKNYSIKRST